MRGFLGGLGEIDKKAKKGTKKSKNLNKIATLANLYKSSDLTTIEPDQLVLKAELHEHELGVTSPTTSGPTILPIEAVIEENIVQIQSNAYEINENVNASIMPLSAPSRPSIESDQLPEGSLRGSTRRSSENSMNSGRGGVPIGFHNEEFVQDNISEIFDQMQASTETQRSKSGSITSKVNSGTSLKSSKTSTSKSHTISRAQKDDKCTSRVRNLVLIKKGVWLPGSTDRSFANMDDLDKAKADRVNLWGRRVQKAKEIRQKEKDEQNL